MISDLVKAIGQLPDPAFRKILWRGVGATAAGFVVLLILVSNLVGHLTLFGIGWLNELVAFGLMAVILIALFILFPAVATAIVSIFLDDIVEAVDARHYPQESPGRPLGLAESVLLSLKFTGAVVVVNLLVLPIYLVPLLNVFVFYGLNGYLFGREYFELVASRHFDAKTAGRLRRAHRGRIMAAGVVIAFFLTIPIVNIAAPVIGAAFMEHVFRRLWARSGLPATR